jgi:hypothetical protein
MWYGRKGGVGPAARGLGKRKDERGVWAERRILGPN